MEDLLKQLVEANSEDRRLDAAKKWKGQGKKVIGYICSYVPEEVIYAAGVLPIRLMGTWRTDTLVADSYLGINSCSFCRSILDELLGGKYDCLDGLVTANSCVVMRRLFDYWKYLSSTPFVHMLDLPHHCHSSAQAYYRSVTLQFKTSLENFLGIEIGDQDLRQAIAVYNETRVLLTQLYEFRKRKAPVISGSEVLGVVTAAMVMPRDEYNSTLRFLLEKLPERGKRYEGKARILISGSVLSNPAEIRLIEELGGLVVADDLCTGARYFSGVVEEGLDPIEAISKHRLTRVKCARMTYPKDRLEWLLEQIRTFNVEGVIYSTLKNCDPWQYHLPLVANVLKGAGIPLLVVEREYSPSSEGQMRTRFGAFIEMVSYATIV